MRGRLKDVPDGDQIVRKCPPDRLQSARNLARTVSVSGASTPAALELPPATLKLREWPYLGECMPFFVQSRVSAAIPLPSLAHPVGLFALAVTLASCVNPVGSSLYQPQPLAANRAPWIDRSPMAVSTRTADGLELTGWFWAPDDPSGDILLFLPGRAGNRDIAARQAEPFARGGRGVLVASYRGYGDNAGKPDEKGLYLDGAAFADLARTMRTSGRLYLFGDGLGAAVALRLAGRPDVSGTATLGAFDRFANFAPAAMRPMYANAFDNVAAISRVKTPVLIMHGNKDQVVPFAAAENLKRAAGGTAILAPIAGEAYHSVDLSYVAATVWQAFDQMGRMAPAPSRPKADR